MPDLDDIRVFCDVVVSGSLTAAGRRLGMSKSLVSRRLARLEAELGASLLARSTRGLSLTEAGADFQPYAERMLAEYQAARDTLDRQGEASGRLRLAAPLSFGSTHLAPVIAELAVRHPRLEIDTTYSDRITDLIGDGMDAAIRIGSLADSRLVARRIATVHAMLVASPDYLARAGTPQTPEALSDHALIPHGDAVWEFRRGDRSYTVRPRGRFTADSGAAELAGVRAGLGIAVSPAFIAGPALVAGDVVQLLPDYTIPPTALHILRPPPADPLPHKVRVLTELMLERFGPGTGWEGCPVHTLD